MVVLDEFEAELRTNGTTNPRNMAAFKARWDRANKVVEVEALALAEGVALCLHLGKKEYDLALLLGLVAALRERLAEGPLFSACLERLKTVLLDTAALDVSVEKEILRLSQTLMYEYLRRGHSLDTIGRLAADVFETTATWDPNWGVSTRYPAPPEFQPYVTGNVFDGAAYVAALQPYLCKLTFDERLGALGTVYQRPPHLITFVFPVWGLRGTLEVFLGEVTLYSPHTHARLIQTGVVEKLECFDGREDHLNVSVAVSCLDLAVGRGEAERRILPALGWLHTLARFEHGGSYGVDFSRWLALEANGRLVPASGAVRTQGGPPYGSTDVAGLAQELERPKFTSLLQVLSATDPVQAVQRVLERALHGLGKAEALSAPEDRLVQFWVVLETLFDTDRGRDKIEAVIQHLPAIERPRAMVNPALHLYALMHTLLDQQLGNVPLLVLPDALVVLAELGQRGVEPSDVESLIERAERIRRLRAGAFPQSFVQHLAGLESEVARSSLRAKLRDAREFYTERESAKKRIEIQLERAEDEVRAVYRVRNQIVHNAHVDSRTVPFYVRQARRIVHSVVRQLLVLSSTAPQRDMSSLLSALLVRDALLEQRFNISGFDFARWPFEV